MIEALWQAQPGEVGGLLAALRDWLPRQRWAGRARALVGVTLDDLARLDGPRPAWLLFVRAHYASGAPDHLFVPLGCLETADAEAIIGWQPPAAASAGRAEPLPGPIGDAFASPAFGRALLRLAAERREIRTAGSATIRFGAAGDLAALPDPATVDALPVQRMGAEQSNTSIVFGDRYVLKAFRKLQPGINPDLEVPRFLSAVPPGAGRPRFPHVPPVLGWAELFPAEASEPAVSLILMQGFVSSQGDGWSLTLDALRTLAGRLLSSGRDLDEARLLAEGAPVLSALARLGTISAELHLALASDPDDPAFRPEPTTDDDVAVWRAAIAALVERVLDDLAGRPDLPATLAPTERAELARVLAGRRGLTAAAGALDVLARERVARIRFHGDYHLGQVLRSGDDWVILDFEGEPLRPLAARRAKASPLRDVAGMLRSLDYARHTVARELTAGGATAANGGAAAPAAARALLARWLAAGRAAYLDAYLATARPGMAPFLPGTRDAVLSVVDAFELDKAIYELDYELSHRPDWLPIPLAFVAERAGSARGAGSSASD